ncbi:MAG: hypothetical protein ABI836_13230 [Gemmatimonadota bacterium]
MQELALFDGIPHDTAAAIFQQWLEGDVPWSGAPLLWWAAKSDTASIGTLKRRADRIVASAPDPSALAAAHDLVAQCQVALALPRHDTTEALRRLEGSPGPLLILKPFLLTAVGRDREALALLEWDPGVLPLQTLEQLVQGRVAERMGDRKMAVRAYEIVLSTCRHADPELQPYVAEARAALARLSGEPRNE